MKELSLDEMKSITIDGLKYFKQICDENGITYFLAYGTLLGAVRHKGYIPWDDDIDIWVFRKDYYHLIDIINNSQNENWAVASSSTDKNYMFEWAKLSHKHTWITPSRFVSGYKYGVSIDIFPIDDVSTIDDVNDVKESVTRLRKKFIVTTSKYRFMTNTCKSERELLFHKVIFKIVSLILGPFEKQIKKFDNALMKMGNGTGKYIIDFQTPSIVYSSDWFSHIINIEFEGDFYKAPKEYDKILRAYYGDYMQLPPESERVTHHYYKAYYRE